MKAYRLRPSRTILVAPESGDAPLFDKREWTGDLPATHLLKEGVVYLCIPKHEPCPVRCNPEEVALPDWATPAAPEAAPPAAPEAAPPAAPEAAPPAAPEAAATEAAPEAAGA